MAPASKGNGNYLPFLHPLHVHIHDPGPAALQSLPSTPSDLWFLFHSDTRCTYCHTPEGPGALWEVSFPSLFLQVLIVPFPRHFCCIMLFELECPLICFPCPNELLDAVQGARPCPPSIMEPFSRKHPSPTLGYWQYLLAEFHGTMLLWKPQFMDPSPCSSSTLSGPHRCLSQCPEQGSADHNYHHSVSK